MRQSRPVRFVGIGVSSYRHLQNLPAAAREICELRELLGDQVDGEPLCDPDEADMVRHLKSLRGTDNPRVVFAWAGHGAAQTEGGLRLLASDSRYETDGMPLTQIAGILAESGVRQLLMIIDCCDAGDGVHDALKRALSGLGQRAESRRGLWIGALASVWPRTSGHDGVFARRLRRVLANGPQDRTSRLAWPPESIQITGDDLGHAMSYGWTGPEGEQPLYARFGNALPLLRNPLYDAEAAAKDLAATGRVVAELLRADTPDEFIGRVQQVATARSWIESNTPGLRLVLGPPGIGKSALLRQVVTTCGPGRVHAWVDARRLTSDQAAAQIEESLVTAGFLPAEDGPGTIRRLVTRLSAAATGGIRPVIVIDSLDQADADIDELAVRLVPWAVVVAARRTADSPGAGTGCSLNPDSTIDLGDSAARKGERSALRRYVRQRLQGASTAMDAKAVADVVVAAASGPLTQPFLFARTITDQLRTDPVDTEAPGWQRRIHSSVRAAFAADLSAVVAPGHREYPVGVPVVAMVRHLLACLAGALGTGLPEAEWVAVADATWMGGDRVDHRDIVWLLRSLGRYIVQAGAAGTATYRLADPGISDLLDMRRADPQDRAPAEEPATRAGLVAITLIERYRQLLAGGADVEGPVYLWRHAWRHAAAGGPLSLAAFHRLAADVPALRPQAGLAEMQAAAEHRRRGRWSTAVPHAARAVRVFRDLANRGVVGSVELADALNNLAAAYRDIDRLPDALAAGREAVAIYRDAGALHRGDLAASLSNLAAYLNRAGGWADAVEAGGEAVALFGTPASDPTDLAMALTTTGTALRGAARLADAHTAVAEAVRLYRQTPSQPDEQPYLAAALTNLGLCLRQMGRVTDAYQAAREAVHVARLSGSGDTGSDLLLAGALDALSACEADLGWATQAYESAAESTELHRRAADTDSVFDRRLVDAYVRQSACLRQLSRLREATLLAQRAVELAGWLGGDESGVGPVEWAEAMAEYANCRYRAGAPVAAAEAARQAAGWHRARRTDDVGYATVLRNLAVMCRAAGLSAEAVTAAAESVSVLGPLVGSTPRLRLAYADTLTVYGMAQYDAELHQEALTTLTEAVENQRRLSGDPARRPDLAKALVVYATCAADAGEVGPAVDAAEEATRIYRELAAAGTAYRSQLAEALQRLAVTYSRAGRTRDALTAIEEILGWYAGEPEIAETLAAAAYNASLYEMDLGDVAAASQSLERSVAAYQHALSSGMALERVLPDLARVLTVQAETAPGRAQVVWRRLLRRYPADAAAIYLERSVAAATGDPRAAVWLGRVAGVPGLDRRITLVVHREARRHRAVAPRPFDTRWRRETGSEPPDWVTMDPMAVAVAEGWVLASPDDQASAYLADHPELLTPSAAGAMAEALLAVGERVAEHMSELLTVARASGVDVAYRSRFYRTLAERLVAAPAAVQRSLLSDHGDQMRRRECRVVIDSMIKRGWGSTEEKRALRARALLELFELDAHEGVLDALIAPETARKLGGLLRSAAMDPHDLSLDPLARVMLSVATSPHDRVAAIFYRALSEEPDAGIAFEETIAEISVDELWALADLAAVLAQHNPTVLPFLIRVTQEGQRRDPST